MPVSSRWLDTTPQAMEVFVDLHRKMPAEQKLEMTLEMSRMVLELASVGVRDRYPGASEREIFLRTAALHLPRDLMMRAYGWHPDLGATPEP